MTRTPIAFAALLSLSFSLYAVSEQKDPNDLVERTITVDGLDGSSMEVTQILKPHPDGSFTIIRLEPEDEVKAYFEAQCATIGAEYLGPEEGETIISADALHGFSCGTFDLDEP